MKVINVSSGADWRQFHHEKVMSTAFIFLLGALGGSSEADRGQFQGHIGGSFIGKKQCPRHLFFFQYWGD